MRDAFELIATSTRDGCVGNQGRLPWRIKEASLRFRLITSTRVVDDEPNVVIMGRKTYMLIPEAKRPLKGRTNIVITGSPDSIPSAEGSRRDILFASSLDDALMKAAQLPAHGKVFVAGGASVYRRAIADARCARIYLTVVNRPVKGDTVVPEFCELLEEKMQREYKLVRCRSGVEDVEYRVYEKREWA